MAKKSPNHDEDLSHLTFKDIHEIEFRLKQFLSNFGNEKENLSFGQMSKEIRIEVHKLCRRMGLKSKSVGNKGNANRKMLISRQEPEKRSFFLNMATVLGMEFKIPEKWIRRITKLIERSPLTAEERDAVLVSVKSNPLSVSSHTRLSVTKACVPPAPKRPNGLNEERQALPVFQCKEEVMNLIKKNKVVLLTGGTGCGKSTQIPQFLLDSSTEENVPCRIVCTQPRRLPAMAVAERVAKERGEVVGKTVGYHIRLKQKTCSYTALTFCTSGVLVRTMSDRNMNDVTHVILDEVHEREQQTDYLLTTLKQRLMSGEFGDNFHLIIMSATMEGDLDRFLTYFPGAVHFSVKSRMHDVAEFYLEDVLRMSGYSPELPQFGFGNFGVWTGPPVESAPAAPSEPAGGQRVSQLEEDWDNPSLALEPSIVEPESTVTLQPSIVEPQPSTALEPLIVEPEPTVTLQPSIVEPQPSTASESLIVEPEPTVTLQPSIVEPQPSTASEPLIVEPEPTVTLQPSIVEPQPSTALEPLIVEPEPTVTLQPKILEPQPSTALEPLIVEPQSTVTLEPSIVEPQPSMESKALIAQPPHDPIVQSTNSDSVTLQSQEGKEKSVESQSFSGVVDLGENEQKLLDSTAESIATVIGSEAEQLNDTQISSDDEPDVICLDSDDEETKVKRDTSSSPIKSPQKDVPLFTGAQYADTCPQVSDSELLEWYSKVRWKGQDKPDLDLCLALIRYLLDSPIKGAILVFLTGYDDIVTLHNSIKSDELINQCSNIPIIHTLHSEMDSANSPNSAVFEPAPDGSRKIILATNIAETSLTIGDVVFVIDCGKVKEKWYQPGAHISSLYVMPISKANAEQRKGRAGRCQEGFCFRLFSRDEYNEMEQCQKPELLRTAIHEVCLHARCLAPKSMSVRDFLLSAPTPPSAAVVTTSLNFLKSLGALTPFDEGLTELGRNLIELPLDPELSRMLLFGVSLRCFGPIVNIVAVLCYRDPFTLPMGDEKDFALMARDGLGKADMSDHITLLRAFQGFEKALRGGKNSAKRYCLGNYLSMPNMFMIRGIRTQLTTAIQRMGFLNENIGGKSWNDLNRNSNSWPIVKAVIAFGSYPGVGFVQNQEKVSKIRTAKDNNAKLHPSCIIKRQLLSGNQKLPKNFENMGKRQGERPTAFPISWVVYQELTQLGEGREIALRTVTAVTPVTVALFCGPIRPTRENVERAELLTFDGEETSSSLFDDDPNMFVLEDWLTFKLDQNLSRSLMHLRLKLFAMFMKQLRNPKSPETNFEKQLLSFLRELLESEDKLNKFPICKDFEEFYGHSTPAYNRPSANYAANSTRNRRDRQTLGNRGRARPYGWRAQASNSYYGQRQSTSMYNGHLANGSNVAQNNHSQTYDAYPRSDAYHRNQMQMSSYGYNQPQHYDGVYTQMQQYGGNYSAQSQGRWDNNSVLHSYSPTQNEIYPAVAVSPSIQGEYSSGGLWRPSVSPPIQGQGDASWAQGDASYSANQWVAGAQANWSPPPYYGTNEAQIGWQMQTNQVPPVAVNSYHSPQSYPTSGWQQGYGNYASSSQNEQEASSSQNEQVYDQSSSQISNRPQKCRSPRGHTYDQASRARARQKQNRGSTRIFTNSSFRK